MTGRLGRALVEEAARQQLPMIGGLRARATAPLPPQLSAELRVAGPDRLEELLEGADVLLSATTPEAERTNLPVAARRGIPCVVATTGLGTPAPEWLFEAARRVPLVVDSNFSLGVAWLRRALRSLGPLPEGYDVSIVETHRRGKADHPSGTALSLLPELGGAGYSGWAAADGRRRDGVLEMASLRAGDVPGLHQVQLAGPHELLRFEHVAFGRSAFAAGMITAARALHRERHELRPGLYRLDDLLGGGPR